MQKINIGCFRIVCGYGSLFIIPFRIKIFVLWCVTELYTLCIIISFTIGRFPNMASYAYAMVTISNCGCRVILYRPCA